MDNTEFDMLLTIWSLKGTVSKETSRGGDKLHYGELWNCFRRKLSNNKGVAMIMYYKSTAIPHRYMLLSVDITDTFGVSHLVVGHDYCLTALQKF